MMEAAADSDSDSDSNSASTVVNRRAAEEGRRRVADDGERRYLHFENSGRIRECLPSLRRVLMQGEDILMG